MHPLPYDHPDRQNVGPEVRLQAARRRALISQIPSFQTRHTRGATLHFLTHLRDWSLVKARRGTISAVERHYFNVFIFSLWSHHTQVLTTAPRYFRKILVAFSSPPIYTKYIKLPRSFRQPDTFSHRRRLNSIPILQRRNRHNRRHPDRIYVLNG